MTAPKLSCEQFINLRYAFEREAVEQVLEQLRDKVSCSEIIEQVLLKVMRDNKISDEMKQEIFKLSSLAYHYNHKVYLTKNRLEDMKVMMRD